MNAITPRHRLVARGDCIGVSIAVCLNALSAALPSEFGQRSFRVNYCCPYAVNCSLSVLLRLKGAVSKPCVLKCFL